mmetsp:Transcript_5780/g.12190  ORF Transcript_5780/g.12190 Transcript_5780/m.12190 type:complete len:271 (-) Transcript_5780:735-1547(-)
MDHCFGQFVVSHSGIRFEFPTSLVERREYPRKRRRRQRGDNSGSNTTRECTQYATSLYHLFYLGHGSLVGRCHGRFSRGRKGPIRNTPRSRQFANCLLPLAGCGICRNRRSLVLDLQFRTGSLVDCEHGRPFAMGDGPHSVSLSRNLCPHHSFDTRILARIVGNLLFQGRMATHGIYLFVRGLVCVQCRVAGIPQNRSRIYPQSIECPTDSGGRHGVCWLGLVQSGLDSMELAMDLYDWYIGQWRFFRPATVAHPGIHRGYESFFICLGR